MPIPIEPVWLKPGPGSRPQMVPADSDHFVKQYFCITQSIVGGAQVWADTGASLANSNKFNGGNSAW